MLKYAVLKNAYQAVVAEKPSSDANPKVSLHQCIIDNAYDAGLLCVNSSVEADNSLITNCGTNISITYGGYYQLTNCTVAAYSTIYTSHKNPVLSVNNFASNFGGMLTATLTATFTNCIFWGDSGLVNNEVIVNKQGMDAFSVLFDHCLYKAKDDPPNSTFTACIKNVDPMFDSINVTGQLYNFHTNNAQAPGIDKGTATGFTKDLDDNARVVGLTDIGCYEKQ